MRIQRRVSPAQGEWIEISASVHGITHIRLARAGRVDGNSPVAVEDALTGVSPAQGEWIEMLKRLDHARVDAVSPAQGEWIEIPIPYLQFSVLRVSPAQGEWIEISASVHGITHIRLARAGRVDGNASALAMALCMIVSPAQGEWIEMADRPLALVRRAAGLARAGRVDGNRDVIGENIGLGVSPAQGEWIEMTASCMSVNTREVSPAQGE